MWAQCASKTRYLYEFDMYTGRKKEIAYGPGASEKLKGTCTKLFFDNFITSFELLKVPKENKIFACGTI